MKKQFVILIVVAFIVTAAVCGFYIFNSEKSVTFAQLLDDEGFSTEDINVISFMGNVEYEQDNDGKVKTTAESWASFDEDEISEFIDILSDSEMKPTEYVQFDNRGFWGTIYFKNSVEYVEVFFTEDGGGLAFQWVNGFNDESDEQYFDTNIDIEAIRESRWHENKVSYD